MSYSSLGPHIWVPRNLGLGDVPSGGYPVPQDAGEAKPGLGDTALNYAKALRPAAQGYLTKEAAQKARGAFRSATGIDVPWVPTDPKMIPPWADQMATLYGSKYVRAGVDSAKIELDKRGTQPPKQGYQQPLTATEAAEWAGKYLASNPGMLTHPTPDGALRMMQSFVAANGAAIGIPPEYVAASRLLNTWPTSVDGAEQWAVAMGSAYLSQYGVPLVSDASAKGFIVAASRFGMSQVAPGIPFGLCEATFESLSDGSINTAEAEGLVVGACSAIGAAVGQSFGVPAPIGALIGQLVGYDLVIPVAEALGFGPSVNEKLRAAQDAAAKAQAAATAGCTNLAKALWLQYQQYWDSVEGNLQAVFRANQEWLSPSGACGVMDGVYLFPEASPGTNTLDYVIGSNGNLLTGPDGHPLHYQYPISRDCSIVTGCPYRATAVDDLALRTNYDLTMDDMNKSLVPSIAWSPAAPGCSALGSLAYWGARRYATPYHVLFAMSQQRLGGPEYTKRTCTSSSCINPDKLNQWVRSYDMLRTQLGTDPVPYDGVVHSDKDYLEQVIGQVPLTTGGTELGQCTAVPWARFMFGSLQQAAAASTLVQRDLARTVSLATTQYGMSKHMEELAGAQWRVAGETAKRDAVNSAAARAAAFRNAVAEARRRGRMKADMLNYGLLAAGAGALGGWALAKVIK